MIKTKMLVSAAAAALMLSTSLLPAGPLSAAPAQAQSGGVSFSLFFDELAPHGVWVRHPQYRHVFCPTGVDRRWRPYTEGRWVYLADSGWYFQSEEPFAWATYHYGRWLDDERLGWCWVPGTQWAPAWVSWRRSDDVVGWAPLPPEGEGYAVSVEISSRDLPQDYWVFVPTRRFIEPDLSISIVFGSDEPDYYTRSEFLGPVVVQGDVVVNNVIEVNYIEQQTNQTVTVYNAQEASDPTALTAAAPEGDTIQIFNQTVAEPTEDAAPAEAVEETEAVQVIQAEGGTAGATEDTEAAPEAEAGAEVTTDAAAPADAEATEEAAPDATTQDEEATDEAAPAADAEATGGETTTEEVPAAEETTTEEATPAETDVNAQDAAPAEEEATEEETAPPEEATTEDAIAPAEEAAPEAAATEEEAAPAEEEAAPATEEAAPAEEEAAPEEASCEAGEQLVDGACLPLDSGDDGADAASEEAPAEEGAAAQ